MKTLIRLLLFVGILMCDIHAVAGTMPEVHVVDKAYTIEGKDVKIAYTDVFTTVVDGQNVNMRIVYSFPVKKNPAVTIEFLTQTSSIYKKLSDYVDSLTPILKNFVYTGSAISWIDFKGKINWYLSKQYSVAGVSLGYVTKTFDDLSPNREDCIGLVLPLSFMDNNDHGFEGKNNWKDVQADLLNGDINTITYSYSVPNSNKTVSVTVPVTPEMVLVIQRLVKAYNK